MSPVPPPDPLHPSSSPRPTAPFDGAPGTPDPAAQSGDTIETAFFSPPEAQGEVGRLGRYRVKREIGSGGMGVVYEAEDTALRRRVALKVMRRDVAARETARARFMREARTQAQVQSDHVVTVFDVGEDQEIPYIALEFLEGMALDKWLYRTQKPPLRHAVRVAREVALGLAAAHKQGLIHRDIKPGNIWLEAPKGRVKILDFGLARAIDDDSRLTRAGVAIGSPAYMSPEQASGGNLDHRSDLFSLGVLLYRMVTGDVPFKGGGVMTVMAQVITAAPEPVLRMNPTLPPPLAELIERLLQKYPADRPVSADAVAQILRAVEYTLSSRSGSIHLPPEGPPPIEPPPLRSPAPQPPRYEAPRPDVEPPRYPSAQPPSGRHPRTAYDPPPADEWAAPPRPPAPEFRPVYEQPPTDPWAAPPRPSVPEYRPPAPPAPPAPSLYGDDPLPPARGTGTGAVRQSTTFRVAGAPAEPVDESVRVRKSATWQDAGTTAPPNPWVWVAVAGIGIVVFAVSAAVLLLR